MKPPLLRVWPKSTLKILQLTDTHLFEAPGNRIHGVDSNENFLKVINHIEKNKIEFDFIFLTGDISQDETLSSYELIAEAVSKFNKPIYWIAGNHDDRPTMVDVFSNYPLFKNENPFFLSDIGWSFIFIDTVLKGEHSGYMVKEKIKIFSDLLRMTQEESSIAIVMHHHPIPVNTPLIDQFILKNRDDFLRVIQKSGRKVDVVICGHVHGDYDLNAEGVRVVSSPATCLQWQKGAIELQTEKISGFTLWKFSEKGVFDYETFFI